MKSIKPFLIVGATSGIAEAVALELTKERKLNLILVARDNNRVSEVAKNITIRNSVTVEMVISDLEDLSAHQQLVDSIWSKSDGLSGVLIAHGILGDQNLATEDFNEVSRIFSANTLSTLSLLTHLSLRFEKQKYGVIAVITSVAGDRGRASNYVYGSSKAAVSTFLSGLRVRMNSVGVGVVDIKPGPIATGMTKHMKQGPMFSSPQVIAPSIVRGMFSNCASVYVPSRWRLIMLIIKCLPDFIFRKLKNL